MNDFDPTIATEQELAAAAAEHGPTRARLMNTEVAMRAFGLLTMLGGGLLVVAALSLWTYDVVEAAKGLGLGSLVFMVGLWLRQLRPVGRTFVSVAAAALVIYALAGANELLHGFNRHAMDIVKRSLGAAGAGTGLLVLMWSSKASQVFAAHYRDVVVPSTPDVRFVASLGTKVFCVLLSVGLAIAVARAVMA